MVKLIEKYASSAVLSGITFIHPGFGREAIISAAAYNDTASCRKVKLSYIANLRITPSGDRMLGYISGIVEENLSKEEIIQLVNEAVAENGIVYGIQERLIASVALELFEQKRIEGAIVIKGRCMTQKELSGLLIQSIRG